MVLEYFVWLRQENNKSIGSLKRTETDGGDAKINSGDAKNIADKSTKITIFMIRKVRETLWNKCM